MRVTLGEFKPTQAMMEDVAAIFVTGRLSYGPYSQMFEQKFANMHATKYGVISNSGTSSLLVALLAMKEFYEWDDGDEVIVPALTFVATVNAVLQANLTPVLIDVDHHTYNMNGKLIDKVVTKDTRCILPVHLFGQSADMTKITEQAEVHGLRILEDSCEAVLATHRRKYVGSWGDIGVFSTYAAHHLVTGVGGMAITNNKDLAQLMRSYVNHGIDLSELPTGQFYDLTYLARKFRFNRIGYSFRTTELEAAIGLAQLDSLPDAIKQRQENARYLSDKIGDIGDFYQLPYTDSWNQHSWMVYPIVLKSGSKWPCMEFLSKKGIECREMLPLTSQPVYGLTEADYPIAQRVNERGFYIGIHQGLTTEHLDYVADALREYTNG